jgi:hypothetical protein
MLAHTSTFWVRTFWVEKRGSSPQEYEDAAWVGPDGNSDGEIQHQSLTVAVADGASESLLAGRWANRLVGVFGRAKSATRTRAGFIAAYQEAVSDWEQEVLKYTVEREERGVPIQWYEEPGLAKGAYATILAVQFSDGREGRPSIWKAVGLGDTCLFQVRDESLYASFPMSNAAAFSYQPPLLASRGTDVEKLRRHIKMKASDWEQGDSFYLATDALSAWFLRTNESEGRPWEPLRDMDTIDSELDFAEWVNEQRDLGQMHNDDTTLIRIDMC